MVRKPGSASRSRRWARMRSAISASRASAVATNVRGAPSRAARASANRLFPERTPPPIIINGGLDDTVGPLAAAAAAGSTERTLSAEVELLQRRFVQPEEVSRLVQQGELYLGAGVLLVHGDTLDVAPEEKDLRQGRQVARRARLGVGRAVEHAEQARIEPVGDVG